MDVSDNADAEVSGLVKAAFRAAEEATLRPSTGVLAADITREKYGENVESRAASLPLIQWACGDAQVSVKVGGRLETGELDL